MFAQILQEIGPATYYTKVFGMLPKPNTSGEVAVKCPFHDDREASMSINLVDPGGVFYCHGCGLGGNFITFHQRYNNIDDLALAAKKLIKFVDADIDTLSSDYLDDKDLSAFQNDLMESKLHLDCLTDERGLSADVIRQFELGVETRTVDGRSMTRVTIPIRDAEQNLVNIRRWLPKFARKDKKDEAIKLVGMPGCNSNVLYPIQALQQQQIYLCEGELDALMMISNGFNAITATAGVNSFQKRWLRLFKDKDVVLMFDNDEKGLKAANELTPKLYTQVRSLRIVTLDTKLNGQDVTDFWYANKQDFKVLIKDLVKGTPPFNKISEFDGEAIEVNLYQAAREDLIGKKIRVRALVTGKDGPFAVPKRIRLTCSAGKKDCDGCPANISDGIREEVIPPYSKYILEMLVVGKQAHLPMFKEIFNTSCRVAKDFEVMESQNIEDIRLMPEVDMGSDSVSYTHRQAYYVGFDLTQNQLYDFTGMTVIDPRNNTVTHVFWEAELVHKTDAIPDMSESIIIDGVEAPIKDQLKIFQPLSDQTVFDKLNEIYKDFEYNVTKIVKRKPIIQAIDITYHSPLAFHLDDEFEKKGWMDTLIIGDTHCGKTRTMKALREHYHAGEIYDGTHISIVGIIGGYVNLVGSSRTPKYVMGVWPLNDRRLVCLDELSGMDKEAFGQLTSVRSEGIAETTKQGQRNRLPARVRFICLSNPRNNKAIPDYPYGVQAVKELIGEDADISRYDTVLIAAGNEVKISDINNKSSEPTPHIYTTEKCNLMIRWAWSRKPTNIKITDEAYELIKVSAQEMANTYSAQIPIVLGQSQRKKIARVAIAIATRLYSTDDGENVIVLKDHVEAAMKMFSDFYDTPAMGYHLYSANMRRQNTLPNVEGVIKLLSENRYMVYEYLVSSKRGTITRSDIAAYSGLPDVSVHALFAELIRYRCITKKTRDYKCTPAFLDFLVQFSHPRKDNYAQDNVDISEVGIK